MTAASASFGLTSLDYSGYVSTALCDHETNHLARMKIQFFKMQFFHYYAKYFKLLTTVKEHSNQKVDLWKPFLFFWNIKNRAYF